MPEPQLDRPPFLLVDVSGPTAAPVARRAQVHRIGSLELAVVTGEPMTVRRRAEHVARASDDRLLLSYLDHGRALVRQDGHEACLDRGDFTLLDSSRPFTAMVAHPFAGRVFAFPKRYLGVADRDLSRLTALPLRQDHGLNNFLIPLLTRLSTAPALLHPRTREQLAANVTDIVATLISDQLMGAPAEDEGRRALANRVKAYITAHLADPGLSPQLIALEHNISVRYLHALFAAETATVSRWVLRARLERCRLDLVRAGARSASVAAIAQRWGFTSPARFSRVFRDAYGLSPREYQAQVRAQPTGRVGGALVGAVGVGGHSVP